MKLKKRTKLGSFFVNSKKIIEKGGNVNEKSL